MAAKSLATGSAIVARTFHAGQPHKALHREYRCFFGAGNLILISQASGAAESETIAHL
jgi:hypothetical protein